MASEKYIDALRHLFETEKELQAFVNSIHQPLPKSCKILTSRVDVGTFCAIMESLGWNTYETPFGPLCDDIRYLRRKKTEKEIGQKIPVGKSIPHLIGLCYLQEVAASLPAHLVPITPNTLILDMCAAPGGKTIQLADALLAQYPNQPGCILANDNDKQRLQARKTNIQRTGCYNTVCTCMDGTKIGDIMPEMFDAVLLDAPCSGEGTGFKSSCALTWRHPEEIRKIVGLQRQLLESAIKACKPGGTIIYSTCTVNQRENEENVAYVLTKYSNAVSLEYIDLPHASRGIGLPTLPEDVREEIQKKVIRCRPHRHQTGGFFVAKIKKVGTTKKEDRRKNTCEKNYKKQRQNVRFSHAPKKIKPLGTSQIMKYVGEYFGIEAIPPSYSFIQQENAIYLLSQKTYETYQLLVEKLAPEHNIHIASVGLPILKVTHQEIIPLHHFAQTFGALAKKSIVELDDASMQAYVLHNDVSLGNTYKNSQEQKKGKVVLIKRRNRVCAIAKVIDGVLKNKFFKW